MELFIDQHVATIKKAQADIVQTVCETADIPAKELIRRQKEYTDLQYTKNWLEQMRAAVQPAMIVPPPPGGLSIVN